MATSTENRICALNNFFTKPVTFCLEDHESPGETYSGMHDGKYYCCGQKLTFGPEYVSRKSSFFLFYYY